MPPFLFSIRQSVVELASSLAMWIRFFRRLPTMIGRTKPTTAMTQSPMDRGDAKSVVQSPSEIVIARRRFASIRLPRSVPRITGTSGTSSFRSTQPSTPKTTMTIRSKVEPEMP